MAKNESNVDAMRWSSSPFSVSVYLCMSACRFVGLSIRLSVCLSFCPYVYLSVSLSVFMSVYLFGQRTRRGRCPIEQRGKFPSVRPSVRTSERTSECLNVRLHYVLGPRAQANKPFVWINRSELIQRDLSTCRLNRVQENAIIYRRTSGLL